MPDPTPTPAPTPAPHTTTIVELVIAAIAGGLLALVIAAGARILGSHLHWGPSTPVTPVVPTPVPTPPAPKPFPSTLLHRAGDAAHA